MSMQDEIAEIYRQHNPGAGLRAWALRPLAQPDPPPRGKVCACGAALSPRNRNGLCGRCARRAYDRKQAAASKAQRAAQPPAPAPEKVCACGTGLPAGNRTGRCTRCADRLYYQRAYAKKTGHPPRSYGRKPASAPAPAPADPDPAARAVLAEVAALGERAVLRADQEVRLGRLVGAGGPDGATATALLVRHNQGLVRQIANRYQGRGLEWDDLDQEGNLGLLTAIARWTPERGLKFSTYATWWVRQRIVRALSDQGRVIRIPVHIHDDARRLAQAASALSAATGAEPTDAALAAHMGWPVARVSALRAALRPVDRLDRRIGPNEEEPLGHLIADPASPDPEAAALTAARRAAVAALLDAAGLTKAERTALEGRFGLGTDAAERTLRDVGAELGVSRERIRQLVDAALYKLRHTVQREGSAGALLDLVA